MDWLDLLEVQGTLKNVLQHPQFKSISSSVLSFLYSPTLTSIHDHWENVSRPRMSVLGERLHPEAELRVGMIHVAVCVRVCDSRHRQAMNRRWENR